MFFRRAGRFDCGCKYTLNVALLDEDGVVISKKEVTQVVQQWDGNEWNKVRIFSLKNYFCSRLNVNRIIFSLGIGHIRCLMLTEIIRKYAC